MDVQGTNAIDYEEFLAATVHASKITSDENLFRAFAELDRDGDGCVGSTQPAREASAVAAVPRWRARMRLVAFVFTLLSGPAVPLRACGVGVCVARLTCRGVPSFAQIHHLWRGGGEGRRSRGQGAYFLCSPPGNSPSNTQSVAPLVSSREAETLRLLSSVAGPGSTLSRPSPPVRVPLRCPREMWSG